MPGDGGGNDGDKCPESVKVDGDNGCDDGCDDGDGSDCSCCGDGGDNGCDDGGVSDCVSGDGVCVGCNECVSVSAEDCGSLHLRGRL